jgi:hypothetical protein
VKKAKIVVGEFYVGIESEHPFKIIAGALVLRQLQIGCAATIVMIANFWFESNHHIVIRNHPLPVLPLARGFAEITPILHLASVLGAVGASDWRRTVDAGVRGRRS